jgi:hypothetical protein
VSEKDEKKGKDGPKATHPSVRKLEYRIPDSSPWAGRWKIFAGLGVLGLAGAAYGYTIDRERFAFSYLYAFFLFLTLGFGSFFFVLVERLTKAHWSVTVRRTAEFFMGGTPIFALLFLPIVALMPDLYPWVKGHAEEGKEHAALTIESEAHAQQPPPEHGGGAGTGGGTGHGDGTGSGHGGGTGQGTGGGHGQHTGTGGGQAEGADGPARMAGTGGGHGQGTGGGVHTGKGRPDPEELEEEKIMHGLKGTYLNKPFFLARAVIYFVFWLFLALRYFGLSTQQDASKDPKLTVIAQKWAPPATIAFGLTLTFAAFDWLMSLNPFWYSTIFGVTIFAGSVVSIFCTLIIVTMSLREQGLIKDAFKVEHFHDMGKLLFGFMIFWAYVSFSQFMLIWYAALPEETPYFHLRWDVGAWKDVSLAIIFLHFVVPFFLILSRNAKRRLPILRVGAMILLAMHCVELYWIVMPNYHHGDARFSWIDAACFIGIGGTYLAIVFNRMTKHALIPVGDPRLSRSLHHEIENA